MIESYTPNREVTSSGTRTWSAIARRCGWEPRQDAFNDGRGRLGGAAAGDRRDQDDYDFHPIPVDRLGECRTSTRDQLKLFTPANTYYYFMNTR